MMNALIALGLGIVIFALVIGVGLIVLTNFSTASTPCGTGFTYQANSSGNLVSTNLCCKNDAAVCAGATNSTTPGTTTTTIYNISGYMQNNLVTWIPAIIALGVGLLFIGALMGRNKGKY